MIQPAVILVLLVFLVAEAVLLWYDQLQKVRAERAHWNAARRQPAPEPYDWAKELDL
jgi:hypothetical protein